MKAIKYRKSVVFGPLFLAFTMVFCSSLLLYPALFSDMMFLRRVSLLLAAVIGIVFFGRIFVILIYVLLKDPTMFSYDNSRIIMKNREIYRQNISNVKLDYSAPTGILGAKNLGFAIHCKDKEVIYIPTYYVLTRKEYRAILYLLRQYISRDTNKEIVK